MHSKPPSSTLVQSKYVLLILANYCRGRHAFSGRRRLRLLCIVYSSSLTVMCNGSCTSGRIPTTLGRNLLRRLLCCTSALLGVPAQNTHRSLCTTSSRRGRRRATRPEAPPQLQKSKKRAWQRSYPAQSCSAERDTKKNERRPVLAPTCKLIGACDTTTVAVWNGAVNRESAFLVEKT